MPRKKENSKQFSKPDELALKTDFDFLKMLNIDVPEYWRQNKTNKPTTLFNRLKELAEFFRKLPNDILLQSLWERFYKKEYPTGPIHIRIACAGANVRELLRLGCFKRDKDELLYAYNEGRKKSMEKGNTMLWQEMSKNLRARTLLPYNCNYFKTFDEDCQLVADDLEKEAQALVINEKTKPKKQSCGQEERAEISNTNDEIRLMEELAEELEQWAAESEFKGIKEGEQFRNDYVEKPYQENYYKFLTRQIKLISIIGKDELNRLIERLKWRKPEIGKALDEHRKMIHSKIDPIFQSSLNGSNDNLIIASVLIDGYAEELVKSLLNIARIIRQESQVGGSEITNKKKKSDLASTTQNDLTDTESNLLEALGDSTLHGPELLKKAGYDNSSHYRAILSGLVKRNILDRNVRGYHRKSVSRQ